MYNLEHDYSMPRCDIEELQEEIKQHKEEIESLKDLLRECIAHLSLGKIGTSVTPINDLLTRINTAIDESEE